MGLWNAVSVRGIDPVRDKMPVYKEDTNAVSDDIACSVTIRRHYRACSQLSVLCVSNQLHHTKDPNSYLRSLTTLCFNLGLIAKDDTCWAEIMTITLQTKDLMQRYASLSTMPPAWWRHWQWWLPWMPHGGQMKFVEYSAKIGQFYYKDINQKDVKDIVGYWANTRVILKAADINNIADPDLLVDCIVIAHDVKLRFQSFPAGTHKLTDVYSAARYLLMDQYAGVARVSTHDTYCDRILGRLRTIINQALSNYTLPKSPEHTPWWHFCRPHTSPRIECRAPHGGISADPTLHQG